MQSDGNTKQKILDVAMALCQEQGVHSLSFREIGQRLGIRSASVHHHYPTKDDLIVALVRKYKNDFKNTLESLKNTLMSPTERLSGLVDILQNFLVSQNRCCLCAVIAVESSSVCCNSQKEVASFFEESASWAAEVFEAGRAAGEFRFAGDAKQAAICFMAALNGMVIAARRLGGAESFRQMADWYLENLKA